MSLDAPEPPHLRHGGSGLPRWLEWATALSALVVSVSSIFIALHNGEIENRMLKANSYPYLIGDISNADPQGNERISLDLINNGVGPADQQSLKIEVAGRYVTTLTDLIGSAAPPGEADEAVAALKAVRNIEHTRFIAAKDRQVVFWIDKTAQNARYWDLLDRASGQWRVEYCYCSVFQECWAVKGEQHTAVKACRRDEPHEFIPRR